MQTATRTWGPTGWHWFGIQGITYNGFDLDSFNLPEDVDLNDIPAHAEVYTSNASYEPCLFMDGNDAWMIDGRRDVIKGEVIGADGDDIVFAFRKGDIGWYIREDGEGMRPV